MRDTFKVCNLGQQLRLTRCVRRLYERSRMTNSFKLAKPSTRVIKFFDRYRHRSCSKASRFSIVSNPLLSNQIALHAVYGDRLSIFLNPRKCKKSLSFKMGFSYPWFSKHDSLTSAADISGKPPAFSFDSASNRLRSFSKKYVLSLSYLSMMVLRKSAASFFLNVVRDASRWNGICCHLGLTC